MNEIFTNDRLERVEITREQSDFLWFLDQCGFDAKVRALRHTDVFDRVRALLMNSSDHNAFRLEYDLHRNFLLDGWHGEPGYGHFAVRRHFKRFWPFNFSNNHKSNLIDVKLHQIEDGVAPVLPLRELKLPQSVQDKGSKRALMLMLTLPEDITFRYHEWAQNLCFIDQLLEQKPNYTFLLQLRAEYHAEFVKLYKSELRYAKKPTYSSRKDGSALDFYKKLYKFQYPVKRDIIRCLCELQLNP